MTISKSDYLRGRQCDLRLWLRKHGEAEPTAEAMAVWEMREREGAEVERLVEERFENPIRIEVSKDEEPEGGSVLEHLVERTRRALEERRPIFQALLRHGELSAVVDILEPRGEGWFLREVKASTSAKPLNDHDLAFQVEVARRCGLEVVGAGLWLLDKEYVRGKELDAERLLVPCDRTDPVAELAAETRTEIDRLLVVSASGEAPEVHPGPRCKGNRDAPGGDRASTCGFLNPGAHCRSRLPRHWVGELTRLSATKAIASTALEDTSIESIDLDDEDGSWTSAQRRQIEAVQTGEPWIDPAALRKELAKLEWPVAYVDFEFDSGMAVPRFEGMSAYTKLPFQWSMHVQPAPDAPLERREPFLWLDESDPRRPFAESLIAAIPGSGSIVVHSKPAEESVLTLLSETFIDEVGERIGALRARLYDTIDLLKAGYYHPAQRGSYSIKHAAPAILGRGYEDLEIQDGMAAVAAWRKALSLGENGARIAADLLEYCGRDTELLHDLVTAIRALASRA